MRRIFRVAIASVVMAAPLGAQGRELAAPLRPYVTINEPVVALTNVRVIDGTGTPAKTGQTVVIQGEKITAVVPVTPEARLSRLASRVAPGALRLLARLDPG